GGLFLAYPGEQADGRNFIAQAISQGAAAVLWERDGFEWNPEWQVANMAMDDLRAATGFIADSFYGQPSKQLWMIGVTGTNGKTSCSHWLAQALNYLGRKTAVIGTLGNGFPNGLSAAINTTPDPILLHSMLAEYLKQGAGAAVMEVSSHGLDQGRVNGVHFDIALFTNLSRDHLDYHGEMAAYGAAKKKLFDWDGLGCAVLNSDDAFGNEVAENLLKQGKHVFTYGLNSGEVRGSELRFSEQGLSMQVSTPYGKASLQAALLGRFNAYNLLAVLATLLASNVNLERAIEAISQIQPVAGRMQQLGGGKKPLVVIDYAHTPDALEKVLITLREGIQGQLVCIFGCGGNRDQGKRPLMGEAVSRLADKAIVTSDNPRHENPAEIISAIVAGMRGDYQIEPDRAMAIAHAIDAAKPGDIVLIAGKGHEEYQEIAGVKHPFSDQQVARQVLQHYRSSPA
ncbi:MAG TPA: UDP-N-acetylmuramoyl-L-alanyl-D-glutamate--2,6-diaminopimelate ligase, partial [Methylophilaceae bacterium]|nr:UDP-N-acetylmuramoyl-L-alanyl-D-glutamate--2,6-diaminopimelate ligase [Methylophilaceae bacterium]